MHELSVVESILEITTRYAKQADACHITNIYLVIGDLSSIVDESVQFYWDIISSGTVAEGAILNFRRIQTRFKCKECGLIYIPTDTDYSCPECSSLQITVINGQEFYVEAIDVENPTDLITS